MTPEAGDGLAALRSLLERIAAEQGAGGLARARAALEEIAGAAAAPRAAASPAGGRRAATFDRQRYGGIIGDSPAMLELLRLLDQVAGADIPVLIQGESGTGKELIARAVHEHSPRRARAFVTENCAAIPETLLESELFGAKRGAFTGADRDRKGLFVTADGGTLFLDEVGDMSLNMQKKLLRALQDGEIRPVGGSQTLRVDVRVVSASNRNLKELVARKAFREDLYYRLNGVTLTLPPLRERRDDVPALARHFLARVAGDLGAVPPVLAPDALAALGAYHWPGNIRELENEMRRAVALSAGAAEIRAADLGDELRGAAAP